jgi:hypothetical protein
MSIVRVFVHQGRGPGIQVELPDFFLERHAVQQIIDPPIDGYLRPLVEDGGSGGLLPGSHGTPSQTDRAGRQHDGWINSGSAGGFFLPVWINIARPQLTSLGS